ncbi:MAG: hypothetical protein RR552_04500 [Oscillospiraceae bacterium]
MKKFLSVILAITMMAMMAVPAFAWVGTNVSKMPEGPAKKIAEAILNAKYEGAQPIDPEEIATIAVNSLNKSDLNAATLERDILEAANVSGLDNQSAFRDDDDGNPKPKKVALINALSVKLGNLMGVELTTMASATTTTTPATVPTTTTTTTTTTAPSTPDGSTPDGSSTTKKPLLPPLPPMTDKDGNTIAPPDADAINGKVQEVIGGIVDFFTGLFGGIGGGGAADPTDPTDPTEEDTTTDDGSGSDEIVDDVPQTGDIALYSVASVALVAGIALVLTKKKKD